MFWPCRREFGIKRRPLRMDWARVSKRLCRSPHYPTLARPLACQGGCAAAGSAQAHSDTCNGSRTTLHACNFHCINAVSTLNHHSESCPPSASGPSGRCFCVCAAVTTGRQRHQAARGRPAQEVRALHHGQPVWITERLHMLTTFHAELSDRYPSPFHRHFVASCE